MPTKQVAPSGGGSLTIGQFSTTVLQRYLRQEFDPTSSERNLATAAGQLYELLSKLRGATGKDSEDAKAPLKAIRNAVDQAAFHTAQGADSPQVEALLQLYAQLEALCQQGMAAGGAERDAAVAVQDALRYRLTRLVTGEAWDGRPQLKLKIVNLMFRFMVEENERLLAGSRVGASPMGAPARTPRQSSFGRKGQAVQARAAHSRWGEALNELGRMQGARLLLLLKLCLHDNLTLSRAAAEAEATAAAAVTAASTSAEREAGAPPPAPASEAGSAKSTGGTGPAPAPAPARAAPLSPATPAHADGGLREPPQHAAQQAQQARQAQQAQFSLDDLLGLDWEPAAGQAGPGRASPPSPATSPQTSGASTPAEQLFAAFDTLDAPAVPARRPSPAAASSTYAQAGASSYSQGGFNYTAHSQGGQGPAVSSTHPAAGRPAVGGQAAGFFPAAPPHGWVAPPSPSPERVRGQLSGMAITGGQSETSYTFSTSGGAHHPASHLASGNPYASTSAVGFDTFPDPVAFPELGPTGPPNLSGSVPNMGGLSQMVERTASDMELMRHNSNPALMPGSPAGPAAAVDTSSPFFGRNPFEAPFGELAPKLAPRRSPPPPPGPPMRSLSNQ